MGIMEECVGIDQGMLQQVIIPTMNVSRRCRSGEVIEEESLNQAQLYITTAGYKNTYSYNKLIQLLVRMVVEPEKAFIMGGTYRIPVLLGLQPRNFIEDLKRDSTFNEAGFSREYKLDLYSLNIVNCWKAKLTSKPISSEAPCGERSTTISQESMGECLEAQYKDDIV